MSLPPSTTANCQAETSKILTGRIEIFFNGVWGAVCDHGFTDINSYVACKQMGFSEGAVVKNIGQGSHPQNTMWDRNVNCTGNEKFLKNCPIIVNEHDSLSQTDCNTDHLTGITCSTKGERIPVTKPNMRIVNINDGLIIGGEDCGSHSKECGVCTDGEQ